MILLFHLLVFHSEIRVLIHLGRFDRRVEVDTVNDFLCEFLLDSTNERSLVCHSDEADGIPKI
jgi:hypothetical protein